MKAIEFECCYCREPVTAEAAEAGAVRTCPQCKGMVKVPMPPMPPSRSLLQSVNAVIGATGFIVFGVFLAYLLADHHERVESTWETERQALAIQGQLLVRDMENANRRKDWAQTSEIRVRQEEFHRRAAAHLRERGMAVPTPLPVNEERSRSFTRRADR